MSVITISRGSSSVGKTLAECLAVKLGYRCIGRETIVERAAAGGVSHDDRLASVPVSLFVLDLGGGMGP
jgi:hypothetical protein